MSKKSNYITTNRSKHYLKIHLIFVYKYRKPLLMGNLNEDMKTILENITNNSDFNIEVMESDINHIHFLIRYIPRLSVSSIVRKLKQESIITSLARDGKGATVLIYRLSTLYGVKQENQNSRNDFG